MTQPSVEIAGSTWTSTTPGRVVAAARIDPRGMWKYSGTIGDAQDRREVKRALVEVADLAGRDACPLGAEIHRLARAPQDALGALEDRASARPGGPAAR